MTTSADEMTVEVRGERWSGWTELEVVRSLDSAVGSFRVTVPPTLGETWALYPGDLVTVGLGDSDPLLVGRVDAVSAEVSAEGRSVVVRGRDLAAVLVDSTVALEVYEWRDVTLRQIVEDIIAPFGILLGEISTQVEERFDLFSCSSTEHAWAVIERACRQKGILAWSAADGKLVLARPTGWLTEVDILEGTNLVRARLRWDQANRFRTYRIEGQSAGSDSGWGDSIISLSGDASDSEILESRILTIRGEQGMTSEDCVVRAQWEATVRRARSTALEVEVVGWRQSVDDDNPFPPWAVDQGPHVSIPSLGIDGIFLVSRVRFQRDLKGHARTRLELVPSDSFKPAPVIAAPPALEGFLGSELDIEAGGGF